MDDKVWVSSVFSKNRQRLIEHGAVLALFEQVLAQAGQNNWLSQAHFGVDGTLIKAWASCKSFVLRKGQTNDVPDDNPDGDSNGNSRGVRQIRQVMVRGIRKVARLLRGISAGCQMKAHRAIENEWKQAGGNGSPKRHAGFIHAHQESAIAKQQKSMKNHAVKMEPRKSSTILIIQCSSRVQTISIGR